MGRAINTHDAAQTLGRAAAEKRRRAELTQRERYDDFHARLRQERDAGLFGRAR